MPPAPDRAGGALLLIRPIEETRVIEFWDALRGHALALPMMAKFALAMAIFVGIPRVSRAASLPGVVGLLLCGILFGPHGMDVFGANPAVADFFSDLGKLLLMFFAGLEIDLQLLRRARNRSVIFGLATTLLPLGLGTLVGVLFGYGVIPALVIGSLLASHTLLGLTILREQGQANREAITVTVGATVISDTVSLIIFAACVTAFVSGFSLSGLGVQMMEIAGFCAIILYGLRHVGGWLLRRTEHEEAAYFVILLVLLAVASVMAELIQLPGIIGAFLAGLALNSTVKDKPATNKLDFVGKTLFIPAFFIVTGFLIDPIAFFGSLLHQFPLVLGIFTALLLGKWAAATLIGRIFGYTPAEQWTMWALTLPQVAATLAAALVAHATFDAAGQPLLDSDVLNAVLVLVLLTAILGPLLTARLAPRMGPPPSHGASG